ncbi:hypothetical protein GL50803_0014046 [Giardia duodenalis]|uniref:Uncharacterized protein n=1 Tax=Giardia intestinalis (strain ATCC 50803 / WB clone C6) TaxID=184922 RepID=A8BMC5_GIAIC|nr:hypothetical protein GL50803_0014046 [Giardia intestinalis]KAE8303990.1 hypothetical protein GL50803_0014046 [Giardia intestinalis]|eukprot:XP_001706069.1 Hypothetical protein GL50803_14046 [Giardia lamblia ATCC 50803]
MAFQTLDAINELAAQAARVAGPAQPPPKAPQLASRACDTPGTAEETDNEDLDDVPAGELECKVYSEEHRKAVRKEIQRTIKSGIVITIISVVMVLVLTWFIVSRFPLVLVIVWASMTAVLTILGVAAWIWVCARFKKARAET